MNNCSLYTASLLLVAFLLPRTSHPYHAVLFSPRTTQPLLVAFSFPLTSLFFCPLCFFSFFFSQVLVLFRVHGGHQLRVFHHARFRGVHVLANLRQAHLQRCQVRLTSTVEHYGQRCQVRLRRGTKLWTMVGMIERLQRY